MRTALPHLRLDFMAQDPVEDLHDGADDFARLYTKLVEALIREGVPEEQARTDATNAAVQVILVRDALREPWDE